MQLHKLSILSLTFTLLASCNDPNGQSAEKVETPKALTQKIELLSYSRGSNLINELYKELSETRKDLKTLNHDLDEILGAQGHVTEDFRIYDQKSQGYYSAASNFTLAISDSSLRHTIRDIIKKSHDAYGNKTSQLNTLVKSISLNSTSLGDHMTALKIILTLPIIEQFQSEQQPFTKPLQDFIARQQQLREQMARISAIQ